MLITKREAAKLLGISTRTIDRYRAAGCFKGVKFGKHTVRFRLSDIQAVVNKGIKAPSLN